LRATLRATFEARATLRATFEARATLRATFVNYLIANIVKSN